jgi:hypothetical protein
MEANAKRSAYFAEPTAPKRLRRLEAMAAKPARKEWGEERVGSDLNIVHSCDPAMRNPKADRRHIQTRGAPVG